MSYQHGGGCFLGRSEDPGFVALVSAVSHHRMKVARKKMGEPWWKLQDFDDPVGNHGNLRVATPSLSGKWPYDRGLLRP